MGIIGRFSSEYGDCEGIAVRCTFEKCTLQLLRYSYSFILRFPQSQQVSRLAIARRSAVGYAYIMLRAGEFNDVVALGDGDFDLLQAIGRDDEYGSDFPIDAIDRLIAAGLVRRGPFWGYDLTTRGYLVAARGRTQQNRRAKFLDGLSRIAWPRQR